MEGNDIERYLEALNTELKARDLKVEIVVIGGVFMMFVLKNRSSTKDIDIIPLNVPDSTQPNKATKIFRSAINAVAHTHGLKRAWMNDVVATFAPDLPDVTLWRSYSHLSAYIPPTAYILMLKLLAGREKDEADIQALCNDLDINTRAQAQELVDLYVKEEWQRECNLQQTLLDFFAY
jgi:hypothetical protein